MRIISTIVLLLWSFALFAQHRTCGSAEMLEQQLQQNPEMRQARELIERHTEQYARGAKMATLITIPVVFHVVHNGEAVGTGPNISEAAILAQLEQMNDDFRKLNSDAPSVPAMFQGVHADIEVQFCLAQRDPSGNATTGINRINGGQADWTFAQIQSTLKPTTIWDRDQYLNVWTVVFGGDDADLLGYAQFPGGPANTDGVVNAYFTTGSLALPFGAPPYDKGRTMTHEVGHWLNLIHIWGDATCGNDLVTDTPVHETSNFGCPAHPKTNNCAGGPHTEMFMNYMDYTYDNCMHMFSAGQKDRMRAVLEAGGPRASLANSMGCQPPVNTCNGDVELALWTFETSVPTTAGPHAAEGGVNAAASQALGFHAATATYSNPVGNGSAESFSSNTWTTVGDYYQFSFPTTGHEGISISWDQTRSGTGPSAFKVQWSTDGTTYTDIVAGAYTVDAPSWSSSTPVASGFSFNLPSGADDQATVYVRLVSTATAAAAGSNRVDNFRAAGCALSSCPTFSGAPANVDIVNSSCGSGCTLSGGSITAPSGAPCPAGSTLQYQVNGGSWSSILPVYDQNSAQSIKTRCSCNSDANNISAESIPVTTAPADCTDNTPPTIICPSDITQNNDSGQCGAVVTFDNPSISDNCMLVLSPGTETFNFTGSVQNWVVPPGVTSITVDVYGGDGHGPQGLGGRVQATHPVTPGETLYLYVGGAGTETTGGFNGGGSGGANPNYGGGGGASDIRLGGTTLSDRIIVAGGGGGTGSNCGTNSAEGGHGGDLIGGSGCDFSCSSCEYTGAGGTQTAGGIAGPTGHNSCGGNQNGDFGIGGSNTGSYGTGGGGGYYGGGSGCFEGAGGGSSYTSNLATNVMHTQGVRSGNGLITITYGSQALILSEGLSSGSVFPVGTTQNTFTVSDDSGNMASCSFDVTVIDAANPTITCPATQTLTLDANCSATLPDYTSLATTGDNCGVQGVTQSPAAGTSVSGAGNTMVTLTATDVNGNPASCTFMVTLVDGTAPQAICKNINADLDADGLVTITPGDVFESGSDNCGTVTLVNVAPNMFDCNDIGIQTVALTVNDGNGNTATCIAEVNVRDVTPPVFECQNITVSLNAGGVFSIPSANYVRDNIQTNFEDNCAGISLTFGITTDSWDCDDIGPNTTTIFARDGNGNETSCTVTVTVTDPLMVCNQPPVAVCQPVTVNADANCEATMVTAEDFDGGSTDADMDPLTFSVSPAGPYALGTTNVILTVSDGVLMSQCATTVTVVDNTPSSIICPATQTLALDANCSASLPDYTSLATTGDNCGVQNVTQSPAVGTSVSGAGNMMVTLTVTDVNNLTNTCTFTVTKIDNIAPTVQCINQTVYFNGEESIALNANDLANASDNCGVQGISLSPNTISATQVGQTVPVTVTATDINGNVATCTAQITVSGFPAGWSQQSGGAGCAGNNNAYNPANGVWTVTSSNCFYGPPYTSDATSFVQRTLCGDGSITAQVTSISGSALGWAGIVMRETNAPGAKKAQLMTNLSNLSRREFRTATNAAAQPQQFPSQNRYWLRIVRAGNQFTMSVSANGTSWFLIGAQNIVMSNCIQMGLVATNYTANSTVTATFSNVSFTGSNGILALPGGGVAALAPHSSQLEVDFNVFPNPTNGELNLDLTQYAGKPVRIELYSLEGKLMKFVEIDEVQTIMEQLDLSSFQRGMYLVRVKSEGLPDATRKVVLNR